MYTNKNVPTLNKNKFSAFNKLYIITLQEPS